MNKKERSKIKAVLEAIKMPRRWDHTTANGAFHSDYFATQVIQPLEKLCGWSDEDEKSIQQNVATLQNETRDERFVNVSYRLKRITEVIAEKWHKLFPGKNGDKKLNTDAK